jgi:hypothetical protein
MPYKDKNKQAEAASKHYQANKDKLKARAKAYTTRQRLLLRRYVIEAKQQPCIICKLSFPPCVMDFHHRAGEKKENDVATMVNRGVSLATLQREIAKCDIICSNCHRIKHDTTRTGEKAISHGS